MPERIRVRCTVNGGEVDCEVEARLLLAQFLREQLGLTGTKVSCEMQVCGVCTVLVGGEPVSACTFLAADTDGCRVETIEGMATGDTLHPLQEAFVENMAAQCGFCTPGFLMMAKALFDRESAPDEEAIREQLDGNICRCTGYAPILAAVKAVAGRG